MRSIPEPTFVLGGVRIDIGCRNLVSHFKVYAGTRNLKSLPLGTVLLICYIISTAFG